MPVCILCMSVWYVMYWCYGLRESTPQPSDEMVVIVVSSIWVRSMMVVIDSSVRFVANMRVSLW